MFDIPAALADLLEAISKPVYVTDPEDREEVGAALQAAWQQRVASYTVEMSFTPLVGPAGEALISYLIEVSYEPGEYGCAARIGAARVGKGEDPWLPCLLAFQRASRMWGMEVRKVGADEANVERLLGG